MVVIAGVSAQLRGGSGGGVCRYIYRTIYFGGGPQSAAASSYDQSRGLSLNSFLPPATTGRADVKKPDDFIYNNNDDDDDDNNITTACPRGIYRCGNIYNNTAKYVTLTSLLMSTPLPPRDLLSHRRSRIYGAPHTRRNRVGIYIYIFEFFFFLIREEQTTR